MPKPSRCDCPECCTPRLSATLAHPWPSLPSLARARAEGFVADTMRALDSLNDLAAGEDTRDAYNPGPGAFTLGWLAPRVEWRVDYTTPGYQPPETP